MAIVLRRVAAIAGLLLVPFMVVAALGGWEAPPAVPEAALLAAVLVVGLLTVDVLLPVPSSAVIVAAGAALGPVVGGVAATCGVLAGAVVGHALGGRVGRAPSGSGADRARALVRRWGPAAVVATRPVPLLAESVSIAAGSLGMGRRRFLLAALAGAVPTGLGLARVGAAGAEVLGGADLPAVLAVTAGLAVVTAVVGAGAGRRRSRTPEGVGEPL